MKRYLFYGALVGFLSAICTLLVNYIFGWQSFTYSFTGNRLLNIALEILLRTLFFGMVLGFPMFLATYKGKKRHRKENH